MRSIESPWARAKKMLRNGAASAGPSIHTATRPTRGSRRYAAGGTSIPAPRGADASGDRTAWNRSRLAALPRAPSTSAQRSAGSRSSVHRTSSHRDVAPANAVPAPPQPTSNPTFQANARARVRGPVSAIRIGPTATRQIALPAPARAAAPYSATGVAATAPRASPTASTVAAALRAARGPKRSASTPAGSSMSRPPPVSAAAAWPITTAERLSASR